MKKILIVEDDFFIRENIFEVLELSGYEVFAASNGKDGLKLAFEILPDLIICDIMMPMLDGYEVRKKLSENIRTKTIPFVFLTAKTEIKELRHGMSLGADDYITKPFEVKDLLNSIRIRFDKIANLKYLFKIESISEGENGLKVMIKSDQTMKSISYSDIVVIKGAGRNSEITRADEEKFRIQKSLKSWEITLPEKTFLRVHQSAIINIDYLETVERSEEDKYFVHLRGYAEPVPVGIRQLKKIKHLTN